MAAVFDSHKNLAYSAVVTAPSPATTGTSLTVTTGQGARFPSSGTFNCTVWPGGGATASPANAEIVRVTAVATDTLTIVRGQEATTAQSIAVGYQIALAVTAKALTDIEAAVNATLGGSLSGTLPNPTIAAGAVGTTQLATGAVGAGQLATGAVGTTQLAAGAVTQLKSAVGVTSGPTTTSTTPVQMPDLTLSITTTGGDLLVLYWAAVNNSTTANVFLGPTLDGAAQPAGAIVFGQGTNLNTPSGSWHFSGVAAGAHTVAIQWNVDAGTGTTNTTRRAMHVIELKR